MHKSILILEENRIVHELFESILPEGKWVWEFHHESIPDNYLQKVQAVQPDVIFLSSQDQKRGYQTIKSLSSDHKLNSIPVILLTTARDQINEAFLESKGVVGFLQKPFEATTFFEQLEAVSGTAKYSSKSNPELDKINVIDDELRALLSDRENHSTGISLDSLENEIEPSHVLQPIEPELIKPDEFEEFDLPDEEDYEEEQSFIKKKEQPIKTQISVITDTALKHPSPLLNVPDTDGGTATTELDVHFGTDHNSLDGQETGLMEELEGIDLDDSEVIATFESDMNVPQDLGEFDDLNQEENNFSDLNLDDEEDTLKLDFDEHGDDGTLEEDDLLIQEVDELSDLNEEDEDDSLSSLDVDNDEEGILELDIGEYEDDGTLNDSNLLIKEVDELSDSDKTGKEDDLLISEEIENLEINLEEPEIILPEIEEELPESARFDSEDTIETQNDSIEEPQPTLSSEQVSETDSKKEDEKLAFLELEDSINALDGEDDTKIEVSSDIFEMDDFNLSSVLEGSGNGNSDEDKAELEKLPTEISSTTELLEEKGGSPEFEESKGLLSDTLDDEIDFEKPATSDNKEVDPTSGVDLELNESDLENDINFLDESIENEPEPNDDFIEDMTTSDPLDQEADDLKNITIDEVLVDESPKQVAGEDNLGDDYLEQDTHETEDYDEIELSNSTEVNEDLLTDDNMDIFEEEKGKNHDGDDLFTDAELFEDSDEAMFEDETEDQLTELDSESELSLDDTEAIIENPESKTPESLSAETKKGLDRNEVAGSAISGHISQTSVSIAEGGNEKPEEIVKLSESEQVSQLSSDEMKEKISQTIHKALNRLTPELVKMVQEELENS